MSDLFIEHLDINDANEFYEILSPANSIWGNYSWVFRGQSLDAPLLPNAHRPNAYPAPHTWDDQLHWEASLFDAFLKKANAIGISVGAAMPGMIHDSSISYIDQMIHPYTSATNGFPEAWRAENLPYLGLSQHFGLPTCLLDWTHNRYKALLFALDIPEREVTKPTIWGLNREAWSEYTKDESYNYGNLSIRFIEPAHLNNARILAQEGLFSISLYEPELYKRPFQPGSVDNRFERGAKLLENSGLSLPIIPMVVKITADVSIAPNIEELLGRHGYDYSSIFPELDYVAKATRDALRN